MENQKQVSGILTWIIVLLIVLIIGYFSWKKLNKSSTSKIEEDENLFRNNSLRLRAFDDSENEEDEEKPEEIVETEEVKEARKKRATEIDEISVNIASFVLDNDITSLNVHKVASDPEVNAKRSFVRLEATEYEGGEGDPGGILILLDFRIPKAAYPKLRDKSYRSLNTIPTEREILRHILGEKPGSASIDESTDGDKLNAPQQEIIGWGEMFDEILKERVSDNIKMIYNPQYRKPRKVLLLEVKYQEQYILRPDDEGYIEGEETVVWVEVSKTIECPRELWEENPFCDRRVAGDFNPNTDRGLYYNIMKILEKDRNHEGISIDPSLIKARGKNSMVRDLRIVGAYFSVRFSYFWQRSEDEKNISGINMDQLEDLVEAIFTDDRFVINVGEFEYRFKLMAIIDLYTNWDSKSCKECAFEPIDVNKPNEISSSTYF